MDNYKKCVFNTLDQHGLITRVDSGYYINADGLVDLMAKLMTLSRLDNLQDRTVKAITEIYYNAETE